MNIQEIKNKIAKPTTKFDTGGFRPKNTIEESWIGKVFLFKEDEEIPRDENGNLMLPLAQFYLPDLPFVPETISDKKVITVFMSQNFPECFEPIPMGKNWLIREYESIEELSVKEISNPNSFLKPFPLKSEFVKEDYPLWDGGGLSDEMFGIICDLEEKEGIEYYDDIGVNHEYQHKFGGYPSFCQAGVDFGENFEFIFQISSDGKANLNVIDSGSLMFSKNIKTNEWNLYYDFY